MQIERIWTRKIEPGRLFDLILPLGRAADRYATMNTRTGLTVLAQP